MLLTKFCKKNNNSSLETTTTISDDFLSINSARLILEEELKKKDEMIQKLQCDSKFEQQKNSKLRQEFLEYSQKTRQSIIESKKEIAAIRRKQKGEIIPKFGYFRDQSGNNFV
jgi:poly(A) polymerase Pap1